MKLNLFLSKIKKYLQLIIFLIIGGISFYSCFDDNYDLKKISGQYEINPRFAITIGTSVFTIDSILNKLDTTNYVHQTDSGLLYIVYDKDLQFYKAEDQFPFTNSFQTNQPFSIPDTSLVFPPSGKITLTQTFYDTIYFKSDQIIDSVHIKHLTFTIQCNSNNPNPGQLKFTFPSIKNNTIAFADSIPLTSGVNNQTVNEDAAGYMLTFTSPHSGYSVLPIRFDYSLTGTSGNSIGSGLPSIHVDVTDLSYYAMYGYAGYTNLLGNTGVTDSIYLSILDQDILKNYNIQWADPRLKLFVTNSYVIMPIRFYASNMSTNSQAITINSSVNPVDLPYPNNMGSIVNDSVVYSKSNTNLFDAIQQKPGYIKFHFDAWSNPDKNTGIENIVVDTSSLKIKAEFYLPIWFRSGGFGTTDTMNFDIEKTAGKDLDSIEYMLFRVVSENGMPVDMSLQVYFTDSLCTTIYGTLYNTKKDTILKAGILGPDDRVISPTREILTTTFNPDQLKALKQTKKLLIKVFLNTAEWNNTNGRYVKFFSDYNFKLSFAVKFQAKFGGYF